MHLCLSQWYLHISKRNKIIWVWNPALLLTILSHYQLDNAHIQTNSIWYSLVDTHRYSEQARRCLTLIIVRYMVFKRNVTVVFFDSDSGNSLEKNKTFFTIDFIFRCGGLSFKVESGSTEML